MSALVVLAGLCAAGAVGLGSARAIQPRRRIARRVAPYTELARVRMGGTATTWSEPLFYTEASARVLGPLASGITGGLSRLLGLSDATELDLRLRRAGSPLTAAAYRRAHLRWALAAPLSFGALGALYGSATLALVFILAGAVIGARR